MDQYKYPDVLVYLVEPDVNLVRSLRAALEGYGFGTVEPFRTVAGLLEAMQTDSPDLIVCDNRVPDGDMTKLIRKLRHFEEGDNPFIPVIAMTWQPTPQEVRKMAQSGTDYLVSKPIAPKDLFDRIDAVVNKRKPFIVTADYIGPDRRNDPNRESSLRRIEVPNSLHEKMTGKELTVEFGNRIAAVWREINDERIGRNAFQAAFLVNLALPDLESGDVPRDATLDTLKRLIQVCIDSGRRLKGGRYEHVGELFQRLTLSAKRIVEDPEEHDVRDRALLAPLSLALNKAVSPDKDETEIAKNISSAVQNFHNKKSR